MLKYEVYEADPCKGYNFPFVLIYPEKMNKDVKIFVEGNNSVFYVKFDENHNFIGYQNFQEQKDEAISYAKYICTKEDGSMFNAAYMYQLMNQPLVIPIIERCEGNYNDEYYTQMLGRNVLLDKTSKFANLTKQVLAMAKEAKNICLMKNDKIIIDDKFGLFGSSASGVFASRMMFAEPESFDICLSICLGAVQPLPISELNGVELPYPLGTSDYEEIFSKPFNIEEYKKAKQMYLIGIEEDNKRYNIAKNPLLHSKEIRDKFIEVYGDVTIQERQLMISKIMQDLGMDQVVNLLVPQGHHFGGKSKYILSFAKAIKENKDNEKPLSLLVPPSIEFVKENSKR